MTLTTQDRFKAALKTIRAAGATTRMNVRSCCQGCAILPDVDMLVWTFGGQGNAYSFHNGEMVKSDKLAKLRKRGYGTLAERDHVDALYLNFSTVEAGQAANFAFQDQGFVTEWDGSIHQSVIVKFI
jgi:hypothetical protein